MRIMKTQSILNVVLSIFLLLSLFFSISIFFRVQSLEYTSNQEKADNFVIQLVLSICESNDTFFYKQSNSHINELIWSDRVSSDFFILKDTTLGKIDYLVFFPNSLILSIEISSSTLQLIDIGEQKSIEVFNPNLSNITFYFVGKYKIYKT